MNKGPNFIKRENTNLIREVWKYKWTTRLESTLIELSVQGGTLKEAVSSILTKKFSSLENSSSVASLLLIEAALMGLNNSFFSLLPAYSEILDRDEDFISVADSCYNMNFLLDFEELLNFKLEEKVKEFLVDSYNKALSQIPSLGLIDYDNENIIISKLKDLYHISCKHFGPELLIDSLMSLTEKTQCNSAVEGAALGILYGLNHVDSDAIALKTSQYLNGTGEKLMNSASFLKGLFSTAKDLLFLGNSLLAEMDKFIRSMEEETFMQLLPDLRFSFTFFNPQEIDSIARDVAYVYKTDEDEVLYCEAYKDEEINLAVDLDAYAVEVLEKWQVYERNKV